MRLGALGANTALMAGSRSHHVVGRDFLLRMAAELLEEAQLTADPRQAEELTQRADDIITLADDLIAADDLATGPY
jgi:hypothetical protein